MQLKSLFTGIDLRVCSYFFGINIRCGPIGLFLSQSAYCDRPLQAYGMSKCKPCNTTVPLYCPLCDERAPLNNEEKAIMIDKPYRTVLGALLFVATQTRRDFSAAVSMLGKFQAEPKPVYWKLLQHVLLNISHKTNYGLLLPVTPGAITLKAWTNADWARDKTARRSRSG